MTVTIWVHDTADRHLIAGIHITHFCLQHLHFLIIILSTSTSRKLLQWQICTDTHNTFYHRGRQTAAWRLHAAHDVDLHSLQTFAHSSLNLYRPRILSEVYVFINCTQHNGVAVVQPGLHQRCSQSCGHRLRQGRPNMTERTAVKIDVVW